MFKGFLKGSASEIVPSDVWGIEKSGAENVFECSLAENEVVCSDSEVHPPSLFDLLLYWSALPSLKIEIKKTTFPSVLQWGSSNVAFTL